MTNDDQFLKDPKTKLVAFDLNCTARGNLILISSSESGKRLCVGYTDDLELLESATEERAVGERSRNSPGPSKSTTNKKPSPPPPMKRLRLRGDWSGMLTMTWTCFAPKKAVLKKLLQATLYNLHNGFSCRRKMQVFPFY